MNSAYIDRLSLNSLLILIFGKVRYGKVYYFHSGKHILLLSKFCFKNKMLSADIQPMNFRLGDVRDATGECQFFRIEESIGRLCDRIAEERIRKNIFLAHVSGDFGIERITLYFKKIVWYQMHRELAYIHAASLHAGAGGISGAGAHFFFQKNMFSEFIGEYIRAQGLAPVKHRPMPGYGMWRFAVKFLKKAHNRLQRRSAPKKGINETPGQADTPTANAGRPLLLPMLASWYMGTSLNLDDDKRSDLFWFMGSGIPGHRVLAYSNRDIIPVTRAEIGRLAGHGIKFLTLCKDADEDNAAPSWKAGSLYRRTRNRLTKFILKKFFREIFALRPVNPFYPMQMTRFIDAYSYWLDFFTANNIKVNVFSFYPEQYMIPMNIALEHCGGVSAAYQWSNIQHLSTVLGINSDILFTFGSEYERFYRRNSSLVNRYIPVGYIADYAFKRTRPRALELRDELKAKGADFIVCFLDENSSADDLSIISHEKNIAAHEHFLKLVIRDPSIGLILKPSYPKTFYHRLAPISELIVAAKKTGRCRIIDDGLFKTNTLPNEASQSADLCVGLLLSGTAALESFLAGVPSVLLDLEKLYSFDIYKNGKGKVVFDSLSALTDAIDVYRKNGMNLPGFGDLSGWADHKDDYKDGHAAERLGFYLNALLTAFTEGKDRDSAINFADQEYRNRWNKKRQAVTICQ